MRRYFSTGNFKTVFGTRVNTPTKRLTLGMIALSLTAFAVDTKMIASNKICAFGVGNSAITAMEISNILARVGMMVTYTPDPHLQAMITSNLTEGDTVILISVSGSTKDIIDVAEIAKKNGVNIIVITCYDLSPLAKYADHILLSTKREAAYEGGSLSTIVSISYIINLIYSAIYEKLGDQGPELRMRAAKSVANKSL